MTKIKTLTLLVYLLILSSCDNKSIKLDTKTYKIEIEKASNSYSSFTNLLQKSPLNIKAERISLKDILAIIIKTDTSNIKFEDKELENEYYNLLIEQKDKNIPVNEIVLNKLLNGLNLGLEVNNFKSFEINIKDTLQYSKFVNVQGNSTNEVFESNDSIKIKNCDLKKLTEILNSEFSEEITCINNYKKIDYGWRKTSFQKLKQNLCKDLGLTFSDMRNDKSIFRIKNN
jgi:hypothetical protein